MSEQLNIYQKLAKIRKQVEVMQRTKKGYGYTYVPEEEILAKISVFMDKYEVSLVPGIVPGTTVVTPYHYTKTKATKDGKVFEEQVNDILVRADTTWTWINNEDPTERIEVGWALVGQQGDASQAFGSGLTYSGRYFLLKYFNVATPNDDPDNFRSKQKQAEMEEKNMVAEELANQIDLLIRTYLGSHPDAKDKVKAFCGNYVKGGNYRTITEPVMLANMISEFEEKFGDKKES